eukprot:TRINITY_DN5416_c0_g1_i6.p1 TRINITY_DN5416_c0_g1~~TRINITY_DN5416_c0_g1_i6.p1  ORF type:complete len:435 (+),score=86.62 TRINITY_DN5416_c0_g1_i6:773-2077(+)
MWRRVERHGPKGDWACWDDNMDFDFCCKPPAPLPRQGDPVCWTGVLRHWHEYCCHGTAGHFPGPRGTIECWERANRLGQPGLTASRCCDFVLPRSAGVREHLSAGSLSLPRCLWEGYATSCSYPGVVEMRQPSYQEILATKGVNYAMRYRRPPEEVAPPVLRVLRRSPAERLGKPSRATLQLLTLGVGPFAKAAQRIKAQAMALGMFTHVHTYENFSFVTSGDERRYAKHLQAWRLGEARIAGFGWWKPVLCRRHLSVLPKKTGLLAFSDAGSFLLPSSLPSWQELIRAMRHFDIMAVVEADFNEVSFTKRATLNHFAFGQLRDTAAAREGQFITGLFVLRHTAASIQLLKIWEYLAEDVDLVNEAKDLSQEDRHFRAHRHEQSLWSLLLKSAVLGKGVRLRPGAPLVNLSVRVLTLLAGFESSQLAVFARSRE